MEKRWYVPRKSKQDGKITIDKIKVSYATEAEALNFIRNNRDTEYILGAPFQAENITDAEERAFNYIS